MDYAAKMRIAKSLAERTRLPVTIESEGKREEVRDVARLVRILYHSSLDELKAYAASINNTKQSQPNGYGRRLKAI